jgi:hypothetical protein
MHIQIMPVKVSRRAIPTITNLIIVSEEKVQQSSDKLLCVEASIHFLF